MILESTVPKDYNAMLRRFKAKYPYLTAWLDDGAKTAFLMNEKLENEDDFIDSLSIEEKDNPIGSYNFDIISYNKDIANLKSYRYGGKLLVKHLKDIDAWEMTVPQMEQKIQEVMDIIEAKILDNKRLQTKYEIEKIKSDF
jgi:hypothetical protein